MADNTEETKSEEGAGSAAEAPQGMNTDQNFAYWLTMLPFLAIAAVFIFEFSKTPGEYTKLINAGGAVVVGIFAASFVNVLTSGSDKHDEGGGGEASKAS